VKIGLVCPYDIARSGGVQEVVLALCEQLEQKGHTARIITPLLRRNKTRQADHIIFVGTAAKVRSPFHTSAEVSVSLNVDEIDSMLEREQFDVLHFHEPWVPIMSRQLLSRSQAVNVATFHAKLPDSVMSRTIEKVITPYTRSVLKYLSSLTAVSETAADYIHSLTAQPITIIPNGVDLNAYRPAAPQKTGTRQILYVGRLEKRKGVKYLLQAFAQLSQTDDSTKLIIVGDGPQRRNLENLVRLQHIPRVSFLGFVGDDRKRRLMSEADIFCSPAPFGESFGIVLLEAMASGTLIVAGDNLGYRSVLKDRGLLSLVNPKDTDDFTRRLELFLHDPALGDLWQAWAKQYVKQFAYPRVAEQYEKLYLEAVSKTSS